VVLAVPVAFRAAASVVAPLAVGMEAGVVQASVEAVMQEAVEAQAPGAAVMQGAAGAELPAAVEVGIGRKPSASGRRTVPVPQPAKVVTRKSNRREVHKLSVWKNI
jgi:hypothetical protein